MLSQQAAITPFRHITLTGLLLLTLGVQTASAKELAIDGYHLSMTIEEVKTINPEVIFTDIRPIPNGSVIGVKGQTPDGNLKLYFTPPKRGGELMRVEKEKVFDFAPNLHALMDKLIALHGRPDQAGRDMLNHLACWGACPGVGPKLLFKLKTFHPIKIDHRMTLILFDPDKEKENKKAYRSANKYFEK